MGKTKLFLVSLLVVVTGSVGLAKKWDKVKCPSDKALAKDFVTLEALGFRVSSVGNSCLSTHQFKYFKVGNAMNNEANKPDFIVRDKNSFKITNIKKVSPFKRKVSFDVYGYDKKGKIKKHSQSLVFVRFSGESKTDWGCAGLLGVSQSLFVKKSCYKK